VRGLAVKVLGVPGKKLIPGLEAARLLDTTTLPISRIALASGFGSVRRFNAVFADVYRRRPSEMRRSSSPTLVPVKRALDHP